jgi:hypothetical protein
MLIPSINHGNLTIDWRLPGAWSRGPDLSWKQGQSVRAQRLARSAAPLTTALFRESNPVPVKYALALLGLISPAVRLPLVELSLHCRTEMGEVLMRLCDEYSEYMIGNALERSEAIGAIAG